MSMTKIVDPAGWDFGRPSMMSIKISSRGLVGHDRSDFLKVASHEFVKLIDQIKVAKDEHPMHLIAMGSTEWWGANRNGDGFKEATCKKYHDTFVKYARWYRNHANKDPKISYGYIKHSAYNNDMHRPELMIMLNAEKSAADRNGGFVADKELQKIAKGEDIPVSMACRVPFDVCSSCENKAKTRDDYCTEETCIGPKGEKRGGCRHNLSKLASDGHMLHVDNPDPLWFDISNVFRPADRTAYAAPADYLAKAASHGFTPGAEMAEMLGVTAPLSVCMAADIPAHWHPSVEGQMKLAMGLAVVETQRAELPAQTYCGLHPKMAQEITDDQFAVIGRPGTPKAAAALGALADCKVFMSLTDFARWMGKASSAHAAAQLLPGVYRRFIESGAMEHKILSNAFVPGEKAASPAQCLLAGSLARSHGLSSDAVRERAMRSSIRGLSAPDLKDVFWNEKIAADAPDAAQLAEQYGLYKLAALYRIASFDGEFQLTARLAIGQNIVC